MMGGTAVGLRSRLFHLREVREVAGQGMGLLTGYVHYLIGRQESWINI